ncbi:hypothetical protein SAMN04487948_11373 [Halogranum amylolyticum]|uniref:Uncharacterized protein n=1 Tax=Halogranum amylolyticum TaxID=660520 RepID=A0A1H8UZI3_9EURY|nr:hypothetical protein SAMN04487948_11373 [Halogranum amylolyticum]
MCDSTYFSGLDRSLVNRFGITLLSLICWQGSLDRMIMTDFALNTACLILY